VTGGLRVFARASPSDGQLDVGVFTPKTVWQWAKVLVREVVGRAGDSSQIRTMRGKKIVIDLERKRTCELDGGARPRTNWLEVRVQVRAITLCVPLSIRPGRG
jgi:diacylglycerol kinase (ATP)